jgi:hypothetical protein
VTKYHARLLLMNSRFYKLIRDKETNVGRLKIDDKLFYVLELPWNDNKDNESCIPFGIYNCAKHNSPKFGEVFKVLHVPNREEILFHAGNFPKDTHGCLLLGLTKSTNYVGESRKAFQQFMDLLKDCNSFELEII